MRLWLLPLVAALFFVSGACALTYQVLWLRLLALVFGVTVYAASTVLASFMSGLALGSYMAGRYSTRIKSPLTVFGVLEIGIGLTALCTPLLIDSVRAVWIGVQPSLPHSLPVLTLARFIASFAVLIVPTTMMGATLPVVMKSALLRGATLGSRVSLLYAVNTAGAIVGALVAGYVLLAEVGVTAGFRIAATTNVVLGVIAIISSRALPTTAHIEPETRSVEPHQVSTVEPLSTWQRRAVLWTFILSGVLSLALEIVWFRMLVTALRPTAYAFTIMLAAVLFGIAAGSALVTPWLSRARQWLPVLTVLQLSIAIVAVLSLNPLRYFLEAAEWLRPALIRVGMDAYLGPLFAASFLAMLPTTMLLGVAFPIGVALFAGSSADAPRRIGAFYALNVCGAIGGSILGGFVLLPLFGTRGSLIATSAVALISSMILAATQWRLRPNFAGFILMVGPVGFLMASLNVVDPHGIVSNSRDRVLWRQEGVQTTVAIHETGTGSGRHRVMYLDGMHQASDLPSMKFVHHRIGAFPMLLHARPEQALVVGLGGGATAGAVAQFPGVTVDVVELSAAVVGGASFFNHINFDLLNRPNVRLRVDDGRNYLLTNRKKYDVITADIILPRHAGASALYSREYFTLVRNALSEDGIVLQWNGGEGSAYNLILRTFLSVFPHTTLWGDGSLMVGSVKPFTFSRSRYDQRRSDPAFRQLFDWSYDELLAMYLGGPPELEGWVGPGQVLTDDRPVIEYFLSLPEEPELDPNRLVSRVSDIARP